MLRIWTKRRLASQCLIPWRMYPTTLISTRNSSSGILHDTLDRNSDSYTRNSKVMDELVSQLHSHILKVTFSVFLFYIISLYNRARCFYLLRDVIVSIVNLFCVVLLGYGRRRTRSCEETSE